jgi:diguanylate cyclase (GGDEF)-like protein
VGFANALYSGYQVQKAQVIANSLASNRAYAEKLAEVINVYVGALHRQLRAGAQRLAAQENDAQAQRDELRRLAAQADAVSSVWLADRAGNILANAMDAAPPERGIRRLADLGVSEPQAGQWVARRPGGQGAALVLAEPVADDRGAALGYVAMEIALDEGSRMDRIISGQPAADGASVFLVSNAGEVLYRRRDARSALVLANLAPIRETGATSLQDADGAAILTGYAPLKNGNWAIVAQRPLDHVLSPVRALLAESLRFAVPAFILTLALVCALAYAVASPLSRLTRAMAAGKDAGQDLSRLPAWYAEADTLRVAVETTLAQHRREVGRLNRESQTDPMTGLMNRRALDEALAEYADKQEPYAVIALDLDHFKRINDTYGHGVGDEVLIALARALREGLRSGDRPFRVGGEEFIALLPTGSAELACEVAERLRAAVAGQRMPEGVGQVTVSVGVALWPEDGDSSQAVIQRADQALYASKQAGRNRVTRWRGLAGPARGA